MSEWRPRWHFSPARHWINDPNGLVFDAATGLYHLFFQHNPFGDAWGHMSWGHATSPDLLHWSELPVAIAEDEQTSIYSGSVVIDHANTAGLGAGAWVAVYTACLRRPEGGQAQALAYSRDRGLTWTKFAGNPVLDLGLREFRDPKVFWLDGAWRMAVVLPKARQVAFFSSPNLIDWQACGRFGPAGCSQAIWECPDLIHFELEDRWLLKVDTFAGHPAGSGAQCWVGQFDGECFTPEGDAFWADHGSDFYAALSWAELPAGRAPIWLAWMNQHAYAAATPTSPWRGAMSCPRELGLARGADGWRLTQKPVVLDALRGAPRYLVGPGVIERAGVSLELSWELDPGGASVSTLSVRCGVGGGEFTEIGIDHVRGLIWIDRSRSGLAPDAAAWAGRRQQAWAGARGPLRLQVLVDACSVEVFSGDGLVALTELIFPSPGSEAVAVLAQGGAWTRSVLTLYPLGSCSSPG